MMILYKLNIILREVEPRIKIILAKSLENYELIYYFMASV